ncbi:M23 family metallopeptidase [Nesterenkonia sp.]|uniref:M23 family metallopeptidase n=1 Tax=Nesterenkonia sp. TaxID=704201 RepID=UPI002608075B|nr:M23 family metallopeptidase [Nesterenkonia sp.]
MSMAEASTPAPFPRPGRPLLWWPRPREVLLLVVLLLGLLGMPPATPVMAAESPASSSTVMASPVSGSSAADWVRPVPGEVVEHFEAPPAPWAAGHRGVDLAASPGAQIRAPAGGVVSFSGVVVDRGVLSINHGSGYVSSFEPAETELETGDAVSQGEVVGTLGTYDDGSHHCAGEHGAAQPCLHWGVRLEGDYINPLLLTGELEPSVLLPLAE